MDAVPSPASDNPVLNDGLFEEWNCGSFSDRELRDVAQRQLADRALDLHSFGTVPQSGRLDLVSKETGSPFSFDEPQP